MLWGYFRHRCPWSEVLSGGARRFSEGVRSRSRSAAIDAPGSRFYLDLPLQFEGCSREPAISPENVTFCIWRRTHEPAWSHANLALCFAGDHDGSPYPLSMLDGAPQTYAAWASSYYERDLSLMAVQAIYRHDPLTCDLVAALNPSRSLRLLSADITEFGYPASP